MILHRYHIFGLRKSATILSLVVTLFAVHGASVAQHGQPVSRLILAFYDSAIGQKPGKNPIHANAEVILNYLGCHVQYWDIQSELPDAQTMQRYRGVLTWFYRDEMPNPEAYLEWAEEQLDAGRRFVILENLGARYEAKIRRQLERKVLNKLCRRVGFILGPEQPTSDVTRISLVDKNLEMVGFERKLDDELTGYQDVRSVSKAVRVYLRVERTDIAGSASDLILTSSTGGFAAAPYIIFENKETFQRQWRLNPFKFFSEAFALDGLPKPDPNTLNGMRVWTSQIDGDAFVSKSRVAPNTYCAEIIRDEILKKHAWPISVSVVIGEILRGPEFADIARTIFEIPWVEAASHAYSHPYYWDESFENKAVYASRHLPIKGYTFNLKTEIIGSVDYINNKLLPPGKTVKQFFWTGNCEPTAEALKLCRDINLPNINGGDSIFDSAHPSYTTVAPLGVEVGGYRQIYAASSNENIYTNDWKGPYFAFRHVLETFDNTETPLRLKPVNIYYHFYSGERRAALNALKTVLSTTTKQQVAPMFVSQYIAMVQGFYSARMEQTAPNSWKLSSFGACRTLRFDQPNLFPELRRSTNVLGFLQDKGILYVHLGEAKEALVVLGQTAPKGIYLRQASHQIADWVIKEGHVSFSANGWGRGEFVLENLEKNRPYSVALNGVATIQRTDINGQLDLLHTMDGSLSVEISRAN